MNKGELKQAWYQEEKQDFRGWDFSYIADRWQEETLPFEDETFDLLLSRHESYDLKEVKRILKPNGIFITQQVGGKNNADMSARLLDGFKLDYSEFTLENELVRARNEGFDLLQSDEYFPTLKFYDIGALVYFAKVIEWEFPGFSVESSL